MKKEWNLSLDAMNVFCTVIDEGGFHVAAKILNISEPAVSIKIKNIEEAVGSILIERGRKICLTQSGKLFYDYAKMSLES